MTSIDKDWVAAISLANWSSRDAKEEAILGLLSAMDRSSERSRFAWARHVVSGTIHKVIPILLDEMEEPEKAHHLRNMDWCLDNNQELIDFKFPWVRDSDHNEHEDWVEISFSEIQLQGEVVREEMEQLMKLGLIHKDPRTLVIRIPKQLWKTISFNFDVRGGFAHDMLDRRAFREFCTALMKLHRLMVQATSSMFLCDRALDLVKQQPDTLTTNMKVELLQKAEMHAGEAVLHAAHATTLAWNFIKKKKGLTSDSILKRAAEVALEGLRLDDPDSSLWRRLESYVYLPKNAPAIQMPKEQSAVVHPECQSTSNRSSTPASPAANYRTHATKNLALVPTKEPESKDLTFVESIKSFLSQQWFFVRMLFTFVPSVRKIGKD